MSITVAVNATDSNNGPQTVCQSAQHNNCGEYNGSGGGDDDMALFDHEKDQHEQLEKDCRNHSNQKDKDCCYSFREYLGKAGMSEDSEFRKWESKWNSLMSYIRTVYRMAMDGVEVERYPPHNIFKEAAYESKSCDSYHVFQNVENLVMEFVLEARARQVQILEKKNKDSPEMPQVFVFCLLDSYRRLMAATDHLKDVIKPIEEYHLSKFNLSWRMMNQYLYHSRLYADRKIYHLVTTFIEQILSISILSKSLLSANLIHDYTKFVKEVNLNISEWAEARTCIHNIKCNDFSGAKKYKETTIKEENGLYSPSLPSHEDLALDLNIPTPPLSPAPEYQERVEADECEDIDDDGSSNYCDCIHDRPTVDSQPNSSVDKNLYTHNGKFSSVQDGAEINSLTFSYSSMKDKMLCFYSGETLTDEDEKPALIGNVTKHLVKKVLNSDAQLKSKTVVNLKCPSTTDKNVGCKVELEQLPKRRYPYPHVSKSTEPASKPTNRQVHGHSCHKHTEHVKRMHHHEETSECSSGRSSQDDSCSERSTSSPRQCDCCYCEVFGHGVPSVAPVSRNYQEMRDRLRNLYLLKKAKQNGHPTNDTTKHKQKESNVHRPIPVHSPIQVSQSSDKFGAVKSVQLKKKEESIITSNVSDKMKLKKDNSQGLFDKPIDELVNFIEGNKATNEKRAAKKARRREKKEEIERIKKEEEEAERKRIEEEERKKQEIERLKREEALKKERKKGKNQNKQSKNNQQKQATNSKTQQTTKQQVQQNNTQSSKKKNKQSQEINKATILTKKDDKCKKNDNVEGAKMVTIKRDSDSSKVTITFRGAVEDDVLCTLYDNEAIKAIQRLCDKSKQPQDQIEEKPNKKRSRNRKKKQTEPLETKPQPKPVESVLITNKNAPKLPTNMKWYCSPDVNITPVPSTTNTVQSQSNTVLIKRTNTNQVFTRPLPPPPSQPMPLTSPTAIQINDAVNKIYSSTAPIDIDKLQLPPGITITKLDPCDYKPPRDIQQSSEKSKSTGLQFPFASPAAVTPLSMQQNAQNVVVKTDEYDYEGTTEWSGAASKRHRRRKKTNECNLDETNSENIQPGFTITNKTSTRDPCNEEGKTIAGQIPTNTPRSMPLPVIIQRHGGMVTIRNPLYQRNDDAILTENNDSRNDGGDDDDANPSGKRRRRRRRVKGSSKQADVEESVFEPKDIDLEDGEMDDDERELEAFKRFCLQSVPPQRKEKVHLNIKDIVLKKKSTAAAAAAAVGCV